MEPFDWDIGPKSNRWAPEEVLRRLAHDAEQTDNATVQVGEKHPTVCLPEARGGDHVDGTVSHAT